MRLPRNTDPADTASDPEAKTLPQLLPPASGEGEVDESRALRLFDVMLGQLEEINLLGLENPTERVTAEFRQLGVEDAECYTVLDLMEMVFRAQEPLLKSRSRRRHPLAGALSEAVRAHWPAA